MEMGWMSEKVVTYGLEASIRLKSTRSEMTEKATRATRPSSNKMAIWAGPTATCRAAGPWRSGDRTPGTVSPYRLIRSPNSRSLNTQNTRILILYLLQVQKWGMRDDTGHYPFFSSDIGLELWIIGNWISFPSFLPPFHTRQNSEFCST